MSETLTDLPAAADVTAADKDVVEAARAAYDALTDDQKNKVSPDALKKLTDAEDKLAVLQAMSEVSARTGDGMTYTGSPIKLVNAPTTTLPTGCAMQYSLDNKDFSAEVPAATDAGTYTVWYKVAGDANHADVEAKSVKATIAKAAPTVAAPEAKSLTYTGSAQALAKAGSATGGTMQYSLDNKAFSSEVPAATDAGTYTVWYKVAGDANHADSEAKSVEATIAKASIAKAKVKLATTSYVYDGKAKKPAVKSVALGDVTLKAGTDYSVAYKANVNPGTATATVTGKGNYEGIVTATFLVMPTRVAKPTIAANLSKGTAKVSWKAVEGAKSYQVQWRKAGGKWTTKTAEGTSLTVKGLKKSALYQIRVRAVAGKANGAWSKASCLWMKSVSKLKAAAGKSKGSVKVSWKADKAATGGFEVFVYAKKGGKLVASKKAKAGATSVTVKGLKSGKKYYVRVRPYSVKSGTTYSGVLSGYRAATAK